MLVRAIKALRDTAPLKPLKPFAAHLTSGRTLKVIAADHLIQFLYEELRLSPHTERLRGELLEELHQTAKATGLSIADCIRQGTKLGLPKLRKQFAASRITNVDPLPDKVAQALYRQPDDDAVGIALSMAAQWTRTTRPGSSEKCRASGLSSVPRAK